MTHRPRQKPPLALRHGVSPQAARRGSRAGLLFGAIFLCLGACSPPAPDSGDLIVHNGHVHTLDDQLGTVPALAMSGSRVVAAGSDDEILRHRAARTMVIDLNGRAVVPGLTDNRFHALGGRLGVDPRRACMMADMLGKIAAHTTETAPGGLVVTNSNWHEEQLAEQQLPLRDDLDEAAPESTVVDLSPAFGPSELSKCIP